MSSHLCRCSRGNDMLCPAERPLEKLITRLEKRGYKRWAHVVDARWATSLLAQPNVQRASARIGPRRVNPVLRYLLIVLAVIVFLALVSMINPVSFSG